MLAAYHGGGVLAASGAGATLVCDPMVDPRGGAYTVGLGVVAGLHERDLIAEPLGERAERDLHGNRGSGRARLGRAYRDCYLCHRRRNCRNDCS